MATKKTPIAAALQFVSLSDTGYKAAQAGDIMVNVAVMALDNIPEIAAAEKVKDISKETQEGIKEGMRLRWNENNPPVEYAIVNDNYIRLDALDADAKVTEKVVIGMHYAFSFTQQEAGALKEKNAQLHAIVADIRSRCKDYCSNAMGDLLKKVKAEKARRAGLSKTRNQADMYADYIKKTLEMMHTRGKTAEARQDPTFSMQQLNAALAAFKLEWQKHSK